MVLRNLATNPDDFDFVIENCVANVSGLVGGLVELSSSSSMDEEAEERLGFNSYEMTNNRRRRERISHSNARPEECQRTNNLIPTKSTRRPRSSDCQHGECEMAKYMRLQNGHSYSVRSYWSPSAYSFSSFLNSFDWPIFMLVLTLVFTVSDACSTRPSPKPRPPRPIWTPDLGPNVLKENCTDDYAELYCMNSGRCYRQKILETFIVNCECQPGFVGTRCQYRDVPDKYLPVQQRIETASIAGGVTVLIVIVTVFSLLAWLYFKRRRVSGNQSLSAGHV